MKTFGLADHICDILKPISTQVHIGFIYGSIAKGEATTQSDVDLMLISDNLTYADIYPLFENVWTELKRTVNPTIYSSAEWIHKSKGKNNFIMRVLEQPKIFLIGNEHELRTLSKNGTA